MCLFMWCFYTAAQHLEAGMKISERQIAQNGTPHLRMLYKKHFGPDSSAAANWHHWRYTSLRKLKLCHQEITTKQLLLAARNILQRTIKYVIFCYIGNCTRWDSSLYFIQSQMLRYIFKINCYSKCFAFNILKNFIGSRSQIYILYLHPIFMNFVFM